ncbi:hypothetical protein C448_09672 [Halococcus morrhuae DSM 1307]|uniref:Uncharacterized protein n=1 Tax=Halococcus morrhuae DSM 1307 TaxID=931277 RepID=M0MGI4_HALMO|nr:hypothetical protein C448_09672 [Halococcus morrhuae DSM 1307]
MRITHLDRVMSSFFGCGHLVVDIGIGRDTPDRSRQKSVATPLQLPLSPIGQLRPVGHRFEKCLIDNRLGCRSHCLENAGEWQITVSTIDGFTLWMGCCLCVQSHLPVSPAFGFRVIRDTGDSTSILFKNRSITDLTPLQIRNFAE